MLNILHFLAQFLIALKNIARKIAADLLISFNSTLNVIKCFFCYTKLDFECALIKKLKRKCFTVMLKIK